MALNLDELLTDNTKETTSNPKETEKVQKVKETVSKVEETVSEKKPVAKKKPKGKPRRWTLFAVLARWTSMSRAT